MAREIVGWTHHNVWDKHRWNPHTRSHGDWAYESEPVYRDDITKERSKPAGGTNSDNTRAKRSSG